MTNEFIMQMRPLFGDEERIALNNYMQQDGFLTEYKNTEIFEKSIATFTGAKHCVVVNNGTISLTLAALALGLRPGDEVIVPNFTMIAGFNSLAMIGVVPILCDVRADTLCLDLEHVKKKISARTKAIMLMNANGREPSEGIAAFRNFCDSTGLWLIEDAAQSLGSTYSDGNHIGTKSDIASFSFSAPKIISTGQGGALITNSTETFEKIKKLKDFGRSEGGNDIHDTIGFNFKFTELQAVVGIEQMKKLPTRIRRKREIYTRYINNLKDVAEVRPFKTNINYNTPWFYDFRVDEREALMGFLKKHNIGTRIMYPPLNEQEFINQSGSFPVSKAIGAEGLWLPSQVQLTNSNVDYISEKIRYFYK